VLCGAGIGLGAVSDAVGGLLTVLGAGAVLSGATIGFPLR
jgi:hypothetical protein